MRPCIVWLRTAEASCRPGPPAATKSRPCAAATEELQRAELTIINNIYCHVINTEELLAALAVA